jgi:transposase
MRRANTGHQADARAVTDKRRLLKCLSCGLEANRDAAGVLNIGYLHGGSVNGERGA